MKGWMIIVLFCCISGISLAQTQSDSLICMNNACFKEEIKKHSSISPIETTDSINTTPKFLSSLIPDAASSNSVSTQEYLSSPAYSQNSDASRYFSIVNEQLPFFKKRFMNVRAYDMDYGTHPEFESTRPKIAVNLFKKKTWNCAKMDWDNM